jgi:tetratricopeptide (TPR) repeat protein
VLFVEALMNTQPWDYWEADGRTPKGNAGEAIGDLERILAADPDHPAAIHLYIHMLEASTRANDAEAPADRLGPLMPTAGHLVHMPSHIYYRLGRYLDSMAANEAAVAADAAYIAKAEASGIYASGYYPHNLHFVLVSAQMAGKADTAIDAAGRLDALIDPAMARQVAWIEAIKTAPYTAHAQLSDPATVLALPDPGAEFPFVRAMWHYARGVALARQGDQAGAEAELEAIAEIGRTNDFSAQVAAYVPVPDLLQMAWHLVRARIAQSRGEHDAALTEARAAATIQESLPYMEPPYWYYPVRRTEGALLLAAGRPDEAAAAFMRSLVEAPNDGWALWGLRAAQEATGDMAAAKVTEALIEKAWAGPGAMPDPMQL